MPDSAGLQLRSKATNDNPYIVGPLSGSLAPYGKASITLRFSPKVSMRFCIPHAHAALPAALDAMATKPWTRCGTQDSLRGLPLRAW